MVADDLQILLTNSPQYIFLDTTAQKSGLVYRVPKSPPHQVPVPSCPTTLRPMSPSPHVLYLNSRPAAQSPRPCPTFSYSPEGTSQRYTLPTSIMTKFQWNWQICTSCSCSTVHQISTYWWPACKYQKTKTNDSKVCPTFFWIRLDHQPLWGPKSR